MANKFNMILLGGLIIVILLLSWKIGVLRDQQQDALDEVKKEIIANDSLVKEKEGQYAKLVDYYNTEKDLKNQLKESNKELYKEIKKEQEKIIGLTNAIVSLEKKVDSGKVEVDPLDTNRLNLTLTYPDNKDPFINWKGSIDKVTSYYKGEWTFGKMPIQIVLTEEKRGLWKTRVVGPEWFKLDSLSVNTLPPDKKEKTIQFLLGGGYIKSMSNTPDGISIGGGVNVFGSHNIVVTANTNKEVGLNYYYKIKSFKK